MSVIFIVRDVSISLRETHKMNVSYFTVTV